MTTPHTPPQNAATGVPLVQLSGGGDSTYVLTPVGYQQLLLDGVSFPVPPTGATLVVVNTEAQAIRWSDDGSFIDAYTGMLVQPGVIFDYTGDLANLAFVDVVSGAIVNLSYYM